MTNYDLLFNKNHYSNSINVNHLSNKNLGCQILPNASILTWKTELTGIDGSTIVNRGGGVIDNQGNHIQGTCLTNPSPKAHFDSEVTNHSDETVIFVGAFYVIWGHLITDCLRRLWFFNSDIYKNHFKNCKLVYLPHDDFNFEKTIYHFHLAKILDILGIDYKQIQPINQSTKFKNIIVPDESFFYIKDVGRVFTNEYVDTIDRIRHHAFKYYGGFVNSSSPFKKIFFFHGMRDEIGEDRIAQYLHSKGFAIINPYKFSFEEELFLFINCECFASVVGSASHNVIFLRDNAQVLLIPRCNDLNSYQLALNQVHNLRVNYIDSSLSILTKWTEGPFFYFISNQLKSFFGDSPNDSFDLLDIQNFINYLKLAIKKNLSFNQKAIDYYQPLFNHMITQLKQNKSLLENEGIILN